MRMAFGCYYAHTGHDQKLHDHIGWPNPEHPDAICQMLPGYKHPWTVRKVGPVSFEPINLLNEGYDEAYVTYEDEDAYDVLDTQAWIDDDDDCIVRMSVLANLPSFSDKPKDFRFTLFIKKQDDSAIDAVCHGIVTVLPGSPSPTV